MPKRRDDLIQLWEPRARQTGVPFPERFNTDAFLKRNAEDERSADNSLPQSQHLPIE